MSNLFDFSVDDICLLCDENTSYICITCNLFKCSHFLISECDNTHIYMTITKYKEHLYIINNKILNLSENIEKNIDYLIEKLINIKNTIKEQSKHFYDIKENKIDILNSEYFKVNNLIFNYNEDENEIEKITSKIYASYKEININIENIKMSDDMKMINNLNITNSFKYTTTLNYISLKNKNYDLLCHYDDNIILNTKKNIYIYKIDLNTQHKISLFQKIKIPDHIKNIKVIERKTIYLNVYLHVYFDDKIMRYTLTNNIYVLTSTFDIFGFENEIIYTYLYLSDNKIYINLFDYVFSKNMCYSIKILETVNLKNFLLINDKIHYKYN